MNIPTNSNRVKLGVCFLLEAFHPVINGAAVQTMLLAQRLVRLGTRVTVLTRQIDPMHPRTESLEGIEIVRVKPVVGLHRLGKYLMILPALFELIRRRDEWDLLIVCDMKVLGVVGVIASKLAGKKCYLRASSCGEMNGDSATVFDNTESRLKKEFVRHLVWLRNMTLKKADAFLCICSPIFQELIQAGVPRNKIVELKNGVNTRVFKPLTTEEKAALRKRLGLPNGFILAYSGRIAKGKGLPQLIRALEQLARTRENIHLLLIGSGQGYALGCEDELQDMVKSRGLERYVSLLGHVTNVHELLQASDAFVFPTEYEALSNSLLEAISCGLPCIVTEVGGNVDIIQHGVNGLLVSKNDSQQFFEAIARLLKDDALREHLGREARQTAIEKFDIEEKALSLNEVCNSF